MEVGRLHGSSPVRSSVWRRPSASVEVYEPTVTTEGFPPMQNVLPLVLEP